MLELNILQQQAASNSKDLFANSLDLRATLVNAVIDSFDAHQTMSKQVLDSERVKNGVLALIRVPARCAGRSSTDSLATGGGSVSRLGCSLRQGSQMERTK